MVDRKKIYIEIGLDRKNFLRFIEPGGDYAIITDDPEFGEVSPITLDTIRNTREDEVYVVSRGTNEVLLNCNKREFRREFELMEVNQFIDESPLFVEECEFYENVENIILLRGKKITDEMKKSGKRIYRKRGDELVEITPRSENIFMILALSFVIFSGIYLTMDVTSPIYAKIDAILLNFKALFLEALPFFLMGSFISAIIRTYLKTDLRFFKPSRSRILDTIKGIVSGLFLPVCDCASVPVAVSLLKKGVNDNFSLGFMLSAPLLNIIVVLSTYAAFGNMKMVLLRFLMGFLTIVLAVTIWQVLGLKLRGEESSCNCCHHDHSHEVKSRSIFSMFMATAEEFLHSFGLLSLGIVLSSIIKVLLPIESVGGFLAIVIGAVLAYLFSLCSSSDAFVSRALFTSRAGILSFLIAGPCMDLKNSLVFYRSQGFKNAFLLVLIMIVSTITVVSLFFLGGLI